MKPGSAGFDGAKGIVLMDDALLKLKRGKHVPDIQKHNFRNQLLWIYPDDQDPKLIYCNHDNQLFELDFIPIEL